MAGAAVIAFGIGAVVGGSHVPASERVAQRYADAWRRGDLARMYALSDAAAHGRSLSSFARAYRQAAVTATVASVRFGDPRPRDGHVIGLPAVVQTRAFGPVSAELDLPMTEVDGATRVAWTPNLVFPGLQPGERLTARTQMPPRADLLARDKRPLTRDGVAVSAVAGSIVGSLGPQPADRAQALRAQGVPADAQVGVSGLQRIFDDALRGTPGGDVLAGARVLAHREPQPAPPLRTTISLKVQEAAVTALAGRLGGVVALRPRSGEILAAAGIPISALQPPGSTFKIVTATAALEAGITRLSKAYPVQTAATLSGVELENADGESCGGTLVEAFAESCNSVFAPLGVQVGARRLVATAERFGFGQDPGIPGAATPTIPPADQIGDDLAVGSSAIGQGRVQATALEMAVVASTIALDGRRPRPTFRYGEDLGTVRVTSPRVAHEVERMMEAVVTGGTGTAAAISGVPVAGKTGTAELEDSRGTDGQEQTVAPPAPDTPPSTDAWFVAYAPAGHRPPRAAVGVMLVRAGAGGDAAAPAARPVLEAAL